MGLKLDPTSANFPRILSVKTSIMSAILTATTRMNDGSLRKKNGDRIAALLDEIKGEMTVDDLF